MEPDSRMKVIHGSGQLQHFQACEARILLNHLELSYTVGPDWDAYFLASPETDHPSSLFSHFLCSFLSEGDQVVFCFSLSLTWLTESPRVLIWDNRAGWTLPWHPDAHWAACGGGTPLLQTNVSLCVILLYAQFSSAMSFSDWSECNLYILRILFLMYIAKVISSFVVGEFYLFMGFFFCTKFLLFYVAKFSTLKEW